MSGAGAVLATFAAVTNQTALLRADGIPLAEVRDLVAYADAYVPLADELEAVAQFLRYSTTAARNLAGTEALTTYSLAQRLARQKRYPHLKPHASHPRSRESRSGICSRIFSRHFHPSAMPEFTGVGAESSIIRA